MPMTTSYYTPVPGTERGEYPTPGEQVTLTGETVAELAAQLPEGFRGNLTVRDETGGVRGWIHGRDDWRAQ